MTSERELDTVPCPDDLRIIAEGLAFPEGPVVLDDGSVVLVEVRGGRLSRIDPDGSHHVVADLGGGPNGAALGPDGAVYVCNNGGLPFTRLPDGTWSPVDPLTGATQPESYAGGRIERVELETGAVTTLYSRVDGRPLRAPNDLVFDDSGGFWFTDTGKTREHERDHGALFYAAPDGSSIELRAYPLAGPNGVGLSRDGDRLFVAETPTGRLRVWELDAPGQLSSRSGTLAGSVITRLPGDMVFDSLAVDVVGNVVVGAPGSGALAVITADGGIELVEMPDLWPTNVAFGGRDGRTAYVTLAQTGRLASFAWPCPGMTTIPHGS